jgi:hypothetical protein
VVASRGTRPRQSRKSTESSEGEEQVASQTMATDDQKAEILALEDDWLESRIRAEPAISETLLDTAYLGVRYDGRVQGRSEFVAAVQNREQLGRSSKQLERSVYLFSDVAISMGLAVIQRGESETSFRYVRMYVGAPGRWKLVFSQATPLR